jgi:hypothetical protein
MGSSVERRCEGAGCATGSIGTKVQQGVIMMDPRVVCEAPMAMVRGQDAIGASRLLQDNVEVVRTGERVARLLAKDYAVLMHPNR